jgi:hypothetical protein
MPRFNLLALAAISIAFLPARAAIFPEQIGAFARGKVTQLQAPDPELYKELGFKEAERAEFSGPGGSFSITGWKVRDSTSALALYEARLPAKATPAKLAPLSVNTPDGSMIAYGNFVFEWAGRTPVKDEVEGLLIQLKQVERSPLPTLAHYLPKEDLVPNSERYILGPISLERFSPKITPSLAAFHLSAEGQSGRYKTGSSELEMTIFDYPTPNMAREQQDAFLKAGAMAKRSGPLVAVITSPTNADDAERLLARVQYQAQLTRQTIGTPPAQGLANLVLTGFLLSGVIIAASLLAGLWLGGFANILKKFGWYNPKEAITVLHLGPERDASSAPK